MGIHTQFVNKVYPQAVTPPRVMVDSLQIDFSIAANNAAIADIIQLFNVAAGTVILSVWTNVKTAEGAAATANIGFTGGDVDGFDAAVDLNTAITANGVIPHSVDGTDALVGCYMVTADTVDAVIAVASLGTAVIEFSMLSFRTST